MNSIIQKIKEELNPAQQEAVFHTDGPLLLIAGAGSGKTKTLVYRVAHLIEQGVPPEQILLLTFTRKAAEEMLKRASLVLDHRCSNVSGGTFHGFTNVALRQYARYINFDPNFNIFDRGDCEDLIQTIRKSMGLHSKEKRFPKKGTINSIISKSINTNQSVEKVILNDYPQFMDFTEDIEKIAVEYDKQKIQMQVMDYDDLLTRFLQLIQNNPNIQEQFQNYYKHILVDEYQDTNTIQSQLVLSITNKQNNIMVVGDDAQSIYSFRGAHFENIIKFPEELQNTKVIKLEQNYRSTQPILNLTNSVISQARQQFDKQLFTENKGEFKPQLIETSNDNEQSQFICKKILELREQEIPLSKIAILMRSGWHSNDLELELKGHNIPFVKMGGFKFVETSHVKDVISYCRILYNPLDLISWTRLLLLLEGCGPAAAKSVTDLIRQNPNDLTQVISKNQKKKFIKELQTLITFIQNPKNKELKPTQILESIMTIYKPIFKLKYDDFNKRESDIESLITISERFKSLEKMLTEMSLEPPTETQSDSMAKDSDNEKISLSTIHSAKGLEWHTVFILSAIDGYLPSFQSLGDINQLEEERRLMYVALTRAEKQLFIMKPNLDLSTSNYYKFSGMQFSKLSRFIEDVSQLNELVDKPRANKAKKSSNFSLPMDDDIFDSQDSNHFSNSSSNKYYF